MYVDFTNINKACPKDCYVLPEIDCKVESLSGFRLKCFLDAYKGYHYIQMAEGDEDKTTFFTGKGFFCYRKCPLVSRTHELLIKDLKPPKTLKEIQSLNEKLATLSRFLSKSADRRSLLKDEGLLRNTTNTYKARIVGNVPHLATFIGKQKRQIFLVEREKRHVPIYFVSRVLQGAQLIYPKLEKLILALVHAARRLGRYFKAHPIRAKAKKPLTKDKAPTLEAIWKLYIDGASRSDGSGVGIMEFLSKLEEVHWERLKYSLNLHHFQVIIKPKRDIQAKGGRGVVEISVELVFGSRKVLVMDPSSSVGKTCLGANVIEISSDKAEGHGDWNSLEYLDTANSGGKKETKAMVFHKMDTEEISDRFVAPCFINGLKAYDEEINLGVEENMISNEFAVKLCLDHEVKRTNKVVKKELIVALRGEIYFLKFIINPEDDDVEPRVVFGKSFLRLTKAIAYFRTGTVIIYPKLDPFLVSSEEEEKIGDEWDLLLDDLDFGDIPDIEGVDVPQFVCKMRKSSRNKRKQLENYKLTYSNIGPSMSSGKPLTQEEAERKVLAISIYERYTLL
ncbi:hypothetical protein Tco_0199716 [Tanacetum coccineum]